MYRKKRGFKNWRHMSAMLITKQDFKLIMLVYIVIK